MARHADSWLRARSPDGFREFPVDRVQLRRIRPRTAAQSMD